MRRREDFPLTKHTLNLYEGDYERLQALFPARIGAAKAIRDLVRHYLTEKTPKPLQQESHRE